jgi:hypothetical protein
MPIRPHGHRLVTTPVTAKAKTKPPAGISSRTGEPMGARHVDDNRESEEEAKWLCPTQ